MIATTTMASKTRTARIALPQALPSPPSPNLGGGMMDTAIAMPTAFGPRGGKVPNVVVSNAASTLVAARGKMADCKDDNEDSQHGRRRRWRWGRRQQLPPPPIGPR